MAHAASLVMTSSYHYYFAKSTSRKICHVHVTGRFCMGQTFAGVLGIYKRKQGELHPVMRNCINLHGTNDLSLRHSL